MRVVRRQVLGIAAASLLVSGCIASKGVPACKRFEGLALVPENNFAASIDPGTFGDMDSGRERIYVTMSLLRPVRGTIDLVHVVGDKELERWKLVVPASSGTTATCAIGLTPSSSTCHALIRAVPHPTGGYYYLRANGNRVLEAGLAFQLCD